MRPFCEHAPMNDHPLHMSEPVWVLDDPRAGTSAQAIGIAERLGVPFRRIPLTWNWFAHMAGLARHGSLLGLSAPARGVNVSGTPWSRPGGRPWSTNATLTIPTEDVPRLVISSGSRSAAVALWLRDKFDCRLVHCMRPGLGGLLRWQAFDLLVIPKHDNPPPGDNVLTVMGAPHRISPLLLSTAEANWRERLGHLPHPRVALLVGGSARGALPAAVAHRLGQSVAQMTAARGGAVLATTSRRTGAAGAHALAAGLGTVLHTLYRWGEPGENPYLGILATADAIVATADSVAMLSEATATSAPVFVAAPELAGTRHRRLIASLTAANLIRPLTDNVAPWTRPPLDEAGRVANEILRRFPLD